MSITGPHAREGRQPGRRQVLGASALGVTSLALPAATAAASTVTFDPTGGQVLATTTGDSISGFSVGGTSYVVHTLSSTSGGTFTPTQDLSVEYVVVAGGGGGGGQADRQHGSGGAGRNSDGFGIARDGDASGSDATAGRGGGGSDGSSGSVYTAGGAGVLILRYALPA